MFKIQLRLKSQSLSNQIVHCTQVSVCDGISAQITGSLSWWCGPPGPIVKSRNPSVWRSGWATTTSPAHWQPGRVGAAAALLHSLLSSQPIKSFISIPAIGSNFYWGADTQIYVGSLLSLWLALLTEHLHRLKSVNRLFKERQNNL